MSFEVPPWNESTIIPSHRAIIRVNKFDLFDTLDSWPSAIEFVKLEIKKTALIVTGEPQEKSKLTASSFRNDWFPGLAMGSPVPPVITALSKLLDVLETAKGSTVFFKIEDDPRLTLTVGVWLDDGETQSTTYDLPIEETPQNREKDEPQPEAEVPQPSMVPVNSGVENGIYWVTCKAPRPYEAVNGYVKLPEGHPFYGMDDTKKLVRANDIAPGGITYIDGRWIGFDTVHENDYWPGKLEPYQEGYIKWTPERVAEETKRLARYISEVDEIPEQTEQEVIASDCFAVSKWLDTLGTDVTTELLDLLNNSAAREELEAARQIVYKIQEEAMERARWLAHVPQQLRSLQG